MLVYIAVAQVWKSDTETIPIPIMGVFPSPEAAQDNAYAVLARLFTTDAPELLECPITVTAVPIPDDAMRSFLTTLQNARPDLLRTPRGKAKI